ncbi:unnamed protein product [Adineta ricciae]|uniref:MULE transposase domain-containing protein n=1 Tax=Adineta ricciae TaxID=249248 RepID=A0A815VXG6_ADIRI|nr:unnamed protein product [Adineta ricciae]CAF1649518.1 unnamed protein product [Adineta ricciae]
MSVTITKTSKEKPLLIYNGYSYTIDQKNETKILWKCIYARKYVCHGRLHTKLNYEFIKTVGQHENHIGNSKDEATRKYYEHLRSECQQNQTTTHNVLTQTNIGVPDEVLVCLPSTSNLKRNIRHWRREHTTEPTPTNIDFPVVPSKYHNTTRNSSFFRKDTGPGPNRFILFFTDEQQFIMENAARFFFQLFAIHASYRDHVIPVAFVLLPSKKEQIYQKMLDEIRQMVPAWQPRKVMMDFEKATQNVFERTFPGIELSGCYFHFCQNVLRFLQNHGFKQNYETDVMFADSIHKILALAFLDPTNVIDGFELLCSKLDNVYQPILDYIEDNYIGRIRGRTRRQPSYPVAFWNMSARVKLDLHRTNNHVEGWHRKLNCAFQCCHPTLWAFLDKLIREENNVHVDIINAMTGRRPPAGKHEQFNRRLRELVENPHQDIYDQITYIGRLLSL